MTRRGNTKTRIRDRERAIAVAVAAKLTGELYVGQHVRIDDLGYVGASWQGRTGVVVAGPYPSLFGDRFYVDLGEASDGEPICFEPRSIKPL